MVSPGEREGLFPGDPIDLIIAFSWIASPISVIRQKIEGSVRAYDHIPDPPILSILKILCEPSFDPCHHIFGPFLLHLDPDEGFAFQGGDEKIVLKMGQ